MSEDEEPTEGAAGHTYSKHHCFFCQNDRPEKVHVMTPHRSLKFCKALEQNKYPHLVKRYAAALDAKAGGLKYHRSCWTTSLRNNKAAVAPKETKCRDIVEWETLQWVEKAMNCGDVLSIDDIVGWYNRELYENRLTDERSDDDKRSWWRDHVMKLDMENFC